MYCGKCGKQCEDDSKFCDGCGTPFEKKENSINDNINHLVDEGKNIFKKVSSSMPEITIAKSSNSTETENNASVTINKNQMTKIVGIVAVAIIAIIIMIVIIANSAMTIDISKLYTVSFEGLDQDGRVEIQLNEAELYNISQKFAKKNIVATRLMEHLEDIDFEVSPEESLSNGDKVVVLAECDENILGMYDVKVKNIQKTYKVKGLTVPEEIDVFEALQLQYSGISPFITCNIDTNNCSDFIKSNVTFRTNKTYFSNGETVKVEAHYNKYDFTDAKVKAMANEKEFIAESQSSYLTSIDNVDLTQVHKDIKNQLQLEYKASDEQFCGVELGWTNHYNGLVSEQNKTDTFYVLKDTTQFNGNYPYNRYAMYYRVKIGVDHRSRGSESKFETEIDIVASLKNLYVDENNTLRYDDKIEIKATEVNSLADLNSVFIKENQEKYNVTTINK